MMTKSEYLKAVDKAKRVIGYVQITGIDHRPIRIFKTQARKLARNTTGEEFDAVWADDSQTILLVG